jgi:NAD kinase
MSGPNPDNQRAVDEFRADQSQNNLALEDLSVALTTFRLAANLLRKSPDQVAASLSKMEPSEAGLVLEALQAVAEHGAKIAEAVSAVDQSDGYETVRKPGSSEVQLIELDRVLILRKESKVQYDMRQQGFGSDDELRQWYEEQGIADVENLYARHDAHIRSVAELEELVGSDNSYVFGELTEAQRQDLIASNDFDLIVSLGGDDTAKDISRYIADKYFLILNSDEVGSIGALASHIRPDFRSLFENLSQGNFLLEEWPRLEAEIRTADDGKVVKSPPAINEIEIGDMYTKWPFRGVLLQEGKETAIVKGNGLLFSTPAGLTGWFASESEAIYPLMHTRPRTENVAELIVRGRYRFGETEFEDLVTTGNELATRPGLFRDGEQITVKSTSNHSATINVDSAWEHRFPRESEAIIRFAPQSLKVISAKKLESENQ